MSKTRAAFKLALRYCKQNEEVMRAIACAKTLADKDFKSFWSNIHRTSSASSTKYAAVIAGRSGDVDIAEMRLQHFGQLYNSVRDKSFETLFL